LGLSKFESQPIDRRLAGLTAAILAHGCYDFLLFQTVSPIARLLAFVVLGICIFYAWGLLRSLLIDSEKRWRI
jgi:RsiW-degrading membrane proteinase PrsW (M82 family)